MTELERDPSPLSRAASSDGLASTPLPSRRPGTGALPWRQDGAATTSRRRHSLPRRGQRPWQSDLAARQAGGQASAGTASRVRRRRLRPRSTPRPGRERPAGLRDRIRPARRRAARGQTVAGRELARLGELGGRKLDRRAVVIDRRRIGKLEPGWGFLRRLRSLLILIIIVAVVGAAFAALLAVIVEVIGAAANHAISKSAGS